ncbi:peptidoglycan-binding protein, partial [Streptomyces tuirus]
MELPNGHPCPECGAPRQRDNTPTCACTHRAAEALRDARTAQAAAAEDFDPLRIRPYVEIDAGASGDPGGATAPSNNPADPTPHDTALRPGTGPAEASPAQGAGHEGGAQGPATTGNGVTPPRATEGTQRPATTGNPATSPHGA